MVSELYVAVVSAISYRLCFFCCFMHTSTVFLFLENSVTVVYGSTLLALRGDGWGSNSQEKNVT